MLPNFHLASNVLAGVDLTPLVGEAIWHQATIDETIRPVSAAHFDRIAMDVVRYGNRPAGFRFLEVAAYAHTSGYILAQQKAARVTLFDVSANTLALGRRTAAEDGLETAGVRLVCGDFHNLPFADGEFDVVYICSALHHTWRWQTLLEEMSRVVAPQGILILDNEPCRRELCFYQSRTNRPSQPSPIERILDAAGLLRTVTEPYLGSRAEQLFGITENQEMRLEHMLSEVHRSCDFLEITATPEICMGEFEKRCDDWFRETPERAAEVVRAELDLRLASVRAAASGCGGPPVAIPDEHAVAAMGASIARQIAQWGYDGNVGAFTKRLAEVTGEKFASIESILSRSDGLCAALQRARMFGAGVRIVARKRKEGEGLAARPGRSLKTRPDGVLDGFPERLSTLLGSEARCLPDMKSAPANVLMNAFGKDWQIIQTAAGPHIAKPTVAAPVLKLHAHGFCNLLLCFRLYLNCAGKPWRVWLRVNGARTARLDVHQPDSALMLATVANLVGDVRVEFECESDSGNPLVGEPEFTVTYALARFVE